MATQSQLDKISEDDLKKLKMYDQNMHTAAVEVLGNYKKLNALGISNVDSLPSYFSNTYGITTDDAANYKTLTDKKIKTFSDVKKLLSTPTSPNNEITITNNNRNFIHTNIQCKDDNGETQNLSVLINNISDDSTWQSYKSNMSLTPTVTSTTGLNQLFEILKSNGTNSVGTMEKCKGVSVYTDSTKTKSIKGYILENDFKNLDVNFVNSGETLVMNANVKSFTPAPPPAPEAFSTREPLSTTVYSDEKPYVFIENNIITKFYFASLVVILLYILFRLYERSIA
jgi:hypothetical protein